MRRFLITAVGSALFALGVIGSFSVQAQTKAAKAVDLNTATKAQLEALPGVGEATAKKIMAARPLASVDDLAKAGVPKATIDKLKPMVTVSAAKPAAVAPKAESKAETSSKASTKPAKASAEPAVPAAPATPSATAKTAPASAAAPVAKTAPAPAAAPAAKAAPAPAATPAVPPPAPGMVWVNEDTKVFHREGDRWYGNTKKGKYMTESDAIKAGYHEAKEGGAKKKQ
jgi:hypothetical protein